MGLCAAGEPRGQKSAVLTQTSTSPTTCMGKTLWLYWWCLPWGRYQRGTLSAWTLLGCPVPQSRALSKVKVARPA